MVQNIFLELSIVIAIATLMSVFMKLLKQPLMIGHIITGIILGPLVLNVVKSSGTLIAFSDIGVAFLLFIVGLNLNFKTLKHVGMLSFVAGISQVILTFIVGYLLAIALGFSNSSSVYISIALAFSSTIIVVKLLLDKYDLESLHGKITVGLLLVQDFIVILILMFLSSASGSESFSSLLVFTVVKVFIITWLVLFASVYVLPRILQFIAKSQELLFLFGISWVLLLSAFLNKFGFTIEIGALFAGISLASSPFHLEIGSKLKPLRDFFIILFFVALGAQMVFTFTTDVLIKIVFLSIFVLALKPIIVMAIIGFMGYKRRIGFLTGISLAQVSEFSFILVIFGMSLGHISQEIVSIVTFVGLISIAGSSYMIMRSEKLYRTFSKYLTLFERKNAKSISDYVNDNYKIILFGYNRIGYSLIKSFEKLKKRFLIVDYNPETIGVLSNHNIPHKYGDASDMELLDELELHKVELVISTIPQLETNQILLEKIRSKNKNAIIVMTSHQIDEAFALYEAGADYVIMPHFLGGQQASALIESFGTNVNKFIKEKMKHLEELSSRRRFGHEHPQHYR